MKICVYCGKLEEEHHEFKVKMPEGCQCDPGEWEDVIEICPKYMANKPGEYSICKNCEHDEICHTERDRNAIH